MVYFIDMAYTQKITNISLRLTVLSVTTFCTCFLQATVITTVTRAGV